MPRWAIVLCKFRDVPEEPVSVEFCRKFFITANTGGLYDYWRDISFGKINLEGSRVLGPFTLSYNPADAWAAVSAQQSELGKDAPHPRFMLLQMAADDVSRQTDLSEFEGLILIHNAEYDAGAAGTNMRLPHGSLRWVPAINLDNLSFVPSTLGHLVEHETGHMLGLPHSHLLEPFAEYGDGWDVMGGERLDGSSLDCRFDVPNPELNYPRSGPGLSAPSLLRLGWIDVARLWTYSESGESEAAVLTPLSDSPHSGHCAAQLHLYNSDFVRLTAELRWNVAWDRGIPRPAILIHLTGRDGRTFLVAAHANQHDWLEGDTYRTPCNRFRIGIWGIDAFSGTATVLIQPTLPYFWQVNDLEWRRREPSTSASRPRTSRLFRVVWRIDRFVGRLVERIRKWIKPGVAVVPKLAIVCPELSGVPKSTSRKR